MPTTGGPPRSRRALAARVLTRAGASAHSRGMTTDTIGAVSFRQVGPCLAAEVDGIDLTRPLSPQEVAAVHAGMDKYAVLDFHDQPLTDDQQLAFTRSLGDIEHAIGTGLREQYRLPTAFADVSNLDVNNQVFGRDSRTRLFSLGNRLWHSDSSFKVIPAKYSLLHARSIPSKGGNTEFADMRAGHDALDQEARDLCQDLICEHSQLFSRSILGFTDFTDEERERFKPVRQVLVRTHPVHKRKSLYLSSHQWRVGDLVMWDNRQTMHRARPFPQHEPRDVRRTTLMGDGPTTEQVAA